MQVRAGFSESENHRCPAEEQDILRARCGPGPQLGQTILPSHPGCNSFLIRLPG